MGPLHQDVYVFDTKRTIFATFNVTCALTPVFGAFGTCMELRRMFDGLRAVSTGCGSCIYLAVTGKCYPGQDTEQL